MSTLSRGSSLSNRIWTVVVVIAFALPFVALAYELARTEIIAAIVVLVLVLAWLVVMFMAWSRKTPISTSEDMVETIGQARAAEAARSGTNDRLV